MIRPAFKIVNTLEKITGLKIDDLKGQPNLHEIKPKILQIIKDKLIIGHSIENDLNLLGFKNLVQSSFDIVKSINLSQNNKYLKIKLRTKNYH